MKHPPATPQRPNPLPSSVPMVLPPVATSTTASSSSSPAAVEPGKYGTIEALALIRVKGGDYVAVRLRASDYVIVSETQPNPWCITQYELTTLKDRAKVIR